MLTSTIPSVLGPFISDFKDLYGTDSRTSTIITSTETESKKTGSGGLWFRVCDTLINVGPIVDMTVGEPTYGEVSDLYDDWKAMRNV